MIEKSVLNVYVNKSHTCLTTGHNSWYARRVIDKFFKLIFLKIITVII